MLTILNFGFLFFLLLRTKEIKLVQRLYLLLFPIILGFIGVLFFPIYDVFKDAFYLFTPILLLSLGYLLGSKVGYAALMKLFVCAGTLFSAIYLFYAFSIFGTSIFSNFLKVRDVVGAGNGITILSLGLLLFSGFANLKVDPILKIVCILLNSIALITFSSRTYWIFFLIFLFTHYRWRIRKSERVMLAIVGFVVLVPLVGYFGNTSSNSNNAFLKKFENSFVEMSGGNYKDDESINTKYRGYETYRAVETYLNGNGINYLIGYGFGKLVDLKAEVKLGGGESDYRRYIPILHNGYMYIIVKTGILGLLFYLIFYFKLFRDFYKISNDQLFKFLFSGLKACILFLIFSNFVIYGFFNQETEFVYLYMGSSLYYLVLLKKAQYANASALKTD